MASLASLTVLKTIADHTKEVCFEISGTNWKNWSVFESWQNWYLIRKYRLKFIANKCRIIFVQNWYRGRGERLRAPKVYRSKRKLFETSNNVCCMLVWSSLGGSQATRTEEEAQAIFDDGRNFLHLYCALAKLSIRLSTDPSCCRRWNVCIYRLQHRMYNPTAHMARFTRSSLQEWIMRPKYHESWPQFFHKCV